MKKIQKIIFTLIYTFLVMTAGFAADFTWTGTQNTDWNDYRNWNKNGSPAALGETPAAGDDVIIPSTTNKPEITNNDVSIKSLTINSGAQLTISNGKTLTLSGNFTHNGGTFSAGPNTTVTFNGSNSKITGTGSLEPLFGNLTIDALPAKLELEKNIKIAGTFTKNGDFHANNDTTVTFTNLTSTITAPVNSEPTFWNLTIAGSAGLQLGSNIKVAGTFTNGGNFTDNGKTVTFVGYGSKITSTANETEFSTLAIDKREPLMPPSFNHNKLTLTAGTKIKIKIFNNIDKGTLNAENNTEITVTEKFNNPQGKFEPGTSTVKLIPSGNTVTITGTNIETDTTFNNLSLTNGGGKTLKINGKISVNGNLVLQGTNVGSLLTIAGGTGGPGIVLNIDKSGGQYLDVKSNIPITGTQTYTTSQSRPENMTSPPANWIFDNCNNTDATPVKWTAGASSGHETKWDNRDNWVPKGVPGINTYVKILSVANSKYPKLESNTYAKAKKVTVEAGTEIDCDEYVISSVNTVPPAPQTNPCSLENYGTLKMKGTGLQNSWFTKITLKTDSSIEYYGTPPSAIDVWAGPYENLKVSGSRQNLRASSITVNKDFTVASASFTQAAGTFIFNGSSTIDGTGAISFNNLSVASSKSVTLNKDIAVGGAFINSSGATFNANGKNITFGGNFTNGGTFTPGTNTVTFNGSSTIGGSGAISFNNLSVASSKSVTLNKDITVNGAFINSNGATFNASTYNITLNSTFSNSGTFNSTDGTNNSFTFNGSFTNSGTFNANADNITFIGTTFTNSGTFAAGTNNTVTLNPPPGGTVTITGTGTETATKFHNLSLTGAGGKTLTINGKISVNGNLTLQGSGAADAQLLTIAGGTNSPGIELSADQTGNGKWLKVHTNVPMIPESGGKTYTVTESKAHEVSGFLISDGNPKNWIFSGYAGPMTWKGTHSSNWNGWQNWQPCGIPGVNSDVTIPQKEAAAHYPKLTAAGAQAKSVTVNSGAELDLGGQIIKKGTGSNDFTPLTNNGTLKMMGTSSASDPKGQKEWFENAIISFSDSSTVEYYGASPAASDIWAGPYQNLKVSGGKTSFTTGYLKVNEYFTVDTTGSFIINADSQSYTKMVTLNKSTTFSSTNAGGTVFESFLMTNGNTVDFSGNGKIETKKDIYGYGNINVISNTGGEWTSSEKIQANIINTQRKWTSLDNVTANGSITANDWTAAGNVTLKGNLTVARFNQTAGTLTFNGTGIEQELKFTGAGNKNIYNLTIDNGAKVKLGSEIKVKETFLNKGTFNHNNKKVTFTGAASIGISGDSGQITEFYDIEIASSASLTLNQDIKIKKDFSNSGGFTVNGKTVSFVKGSAPVSAASTISGNAVSFANLSIESGKTLTLNNASLEISGTLTNDGVFDAQAHNKTVTFIGTNAEITRTQASPSPMPENKFHILKIADSATLKVVLSGINNNEHNKFVQIDIKNSFVNGQDGIFIPHFSNFVFSGTANTNSINHNINFTDITIPSTGSLTLNKPITVGGTFTSNGTFTAGANKVTFRGGNHGLEITKGTGSSGTMTFSEIEILGDAHLALKRDITVTEKIYYTEKNGNLGKFTADPGTTVTLNPPPGGTVTITGTGTVGDTAFNNLSLTGAGGKTLTINGKISVNGNLTLQGSGAADAQLLTIAGGTNSPGIELSANQTGNGKWLNVHTNVPMIPESGGKTYTVTESKAHEVSGFPLSDGNPKNWIFSGYAGSMTWKGTHSNNWNGWQNWRPYGIPGGNSDVTIPQKEAAAHYPKLTANVSAKSVTVNTGAELDLTHYTIKKGPPTAKLTNNGTIKMTGSGDQLSWFSAGNNDNITLGNTSTVEYYDAPPSNANIWAGPYENLKVSGGKTSFTTGNLIVNKAFTVDTTGSFTVNADSQNYKGAVELKKETTFKSDLSVGTIFENNLKTFGNSITFDGNGEIKTRDIMLALGSGTIAVKEGTGDWTSAGQITVKDIIVKRNWTSSSHITASGDITADNTAHTNIWTSNLGDIKLAGNLTAAQFNQTAGTLTFNGTGTPEQELKFTGAGNKNIKNLAINSSAKVKLGSNITIQGNFTNSGTFDATTVPGYTITLTNGADHTITGTGTASNTKFHNLSLTGAGGKKLVIDKKISVLGNLTLTGTSTDKLTIEGVSTNSSIALTTANSAHGQYLKVRTNIPITGGTYTAEDSLPDGSDTDIQAGKPENWIFTNYNGTLTWKGSVDSNWNDRRNWEPALAIPGINTDVTIPQKAGPAHHYPILAGNAEANSITIAAPATLDLNGFVISDNSGRSPLAVHGTLKLKGTADQKNWFAAASPADKITLQNTSTVVYYDNSTANIWGGTYYKLQAQNRDKLITGGDFLTVEGTFKVTHTTPPSTLEIDTGNGAQHYKSSITATGINLSFKTASLKTMKDTPANLTEVTAANITVNGDWTSNSTVNAQTVTVLSGGSWTSKKGKITLTGNLDAAKFVQNEGDLIFNGTGNRQLSINSSDSKIKNLVINATASVKLGSNITIQGNFTNSGTFDATNTGSPPGYTVTLTNDGNHDITGSNTAAGTKFYNLICINAGGKQIKFNKKISVHGNLTLQGSSISNLLNISGTDNDAEIYVKSNQGTASGYECKWLGVAENLPIKSLTSSTYTCTTDESKPTGNINSIIAGKPENWIFTNVYELRWTGEANDNNWNNPNNWRPRTSHAPKPTQFATVRAVAAGKHPILGSGDYYAKKVEVVGTATLDLADKLIYSNTAKTATAELTAKGTLRLKGTDGQKNWFEHSNLSNRMTITQNSTVEYYNSAPPTIKLWGGGTDGYNKLILNNIGTCETENSNLKVNGELSVEGSNVTINSGGGTQTYNGAINATGKDITIEGSTITTKHNITANKIKVLGDWNSNSGTITASTNIEAAKWTSADEVITRAGNNITVTGAWDSKGSTITANNIEAKKNWDSSGNVTSNGNIKVDNGYLWKPTAGDIKLKGNLTAGKFNQTGGTLTFNGTGTPEQELKFTGAGDKNIFNLTIDSGAKVKLGSNITIQRNFTNSGTFNDYTYTVTLSPTGNTVTITGTGTASNTKFNKLECTTSTTTKTLNISGKISVTGTLTLSGASGKPLTINGSNSAEIHLSNSHGLTSGTAKGNFLMIYTGKVRIQSTGSTGKYYVVKDSKDDSGSTISKNGWIFYKDSLQIVNSFAKPNDNHIYLLFDDDSLSTEEFHSLNALTHSLQITDGVTTYTSNLQTVHKEPSSYIPSGHSLWKIQLDGTQKFNPDDILKSTYQVSLNYFGTLKHKAQISDIGIDMVKPLTASNSIVLRNFNAGDNDPALPTLDVRVLAEKAPSSSNVILHFFSKNSAEHKFWHPDTIPSPPGSFANPQAGTTNYSPTLNGNLITSIIPSTDPSLKEGKVGQFMYVYNNWLPCARLRNPNDILSFDVWNFKIVGVRMQKGGVSIFDNVVNPHKGQSATIAAHLKKSGMLTIQIMTLDGNIVRTLTRSHHNAGDHFYLWDGRNNGGNPVASGMYFVRIAGPDIDEVRKILIIK
ncbi:FlgD immunoglobulin-like domain containing protein [Treponema putidum]|uniref:FlgD/Vpr Ig-like domain-containing protein n=1 Tax=Treponema putidum TaxID=221027 RepID=A0AAE9MT68_9SPIR|nr:FlgD immunoglobulin-like domain containing protein [Treponema putidum]UTY34555.1 hypothetical protein E4N74_11470 [Treponema putidum]